MESTDGGTEKILRTGAHLSPSELHLYNNMDYQELLIPNLVTSTCFLDEQTGEILDEDLPAVV